MEYIMDFEKLTIQELLALNKLVCEAISKKRSLEAAIKINNFNIGDKVKYQGSAKCAPFEATVEKVLRVNVDVITNQGKKWRINASMLSHI